MSETPENTTVTDVTEAIPTMSPESKSLTAKFATVATLAGVGVLAINAGLSKLKREKKVQAVVTDLHPETPNTTTP
jgi:hypothetical protein